MAHNLSHEAIRRRIAYEHECTMAMVVETLIAEGAAVEAEGRLCKHVWKVDLQAYVEAGLARLSLRWEELRCPTCGALSWPTFTVRHA